MVCHALLHNAEHNKNSQWLVLGLRIYSIVGILILYKVQLDLTTTYICSCIKIYFFTFIFS